MRAALRRLALLAALACAQASCNRETRVEAPPPPPGKKVSLVFTAALDGSLAPCGCSEGMRGGLDKTALVVERLRQSAPTLFFDGGNLLFGAQTLPEEAVPQQERKARALADALAKMRLSATTPGPLDSARGETFRKLRGLPELLGKGLYDAGGVTIGVLSAADAETVKRLAGELRVEGARFVVALLPVSWDEALKIILAENVGIDLGVVTRPKGGVSEENRVLGGRVKLVQLQDRGRSVLRVDLSFRPGQQFEWLKGTGDKQRELSALDERIEALRAQVNQPGIGDELKALKQAKLAEVVSRREAVADAPLPEPLDKSSGTLRPVAIEASLPGDPAVGAIITEYDRDVGKMNLDWAKQYGHDCPQATPDHPAVVGSLACAGCHLPAFTLWQQSKHVHAHEALAAKGKENHLDCVACHVLGWKQPGGVCRLDKVLGRTEVGCESCHGPGLEHLKLPTKATIRRPDAATCKGCHDRENSPHFDFDTYVAKIVGEGHGKPMLDGGVPSLGAVTQARTSPK